MNKPVRLALPEYPRALLQREGVHCQFRCRKVWQPAVPRRDFDPIMPARLTESDPETLYSSTYAMNHQNLHDLQ